MANATPTKSKGQSFQLNAYRFSHSVVVVEKTNNRRFFRITDIKLNKTAFGFVIAAATAVS